jgi:hypothetical protein
VPASYTFPTVICRLPMAYVAVSGAVKIQRNNSPVCYEQPGKSKCISAINLL